MKSQDLKLLLGSADMGVVSPGKLGYVSLALKRLGCVSSTPPTCQVGAFFGLGWSDWGCYFLWAPRSCWSVRPTVCHKPFC
jgi:hypothetical protein